MLLLALHSDPLPAATRQLPHQCGPLQGQLSAWAEGGALWIPSFCNPGKAGRPGPLPRWGAHPPGSSGPSAPPAGHRHGCQWRLLGSQAEHPALTGEATWETQQLQRRGLPETQQS